MRPIFTLLFILLVIVSCNKQKDYPITQTKTIIQAEPETDSIIELSKLKVGTTFKLTKYDPNRFLKNIFGNYGINGTSAIWRLEDSDFNRFLVSDTIFVNVDNRSCVNKGFYSHSDTVKSSRILRDSFIFSDVYSIQWVNNSVYVFIISDYLKVRSNSNRYNDSIQFTNNYYSPNPNGDARTDVFLGCIKLLYDPNSREFTVIDIKPFITFLPYFDLGLSRILINEKEINNIDFVAKVVQYVPRSRNVDTLDSDIEPKEYYLLDTNLNISYLGTCLNDRKIKNNLWYYLRDSTLMNDYKLYYDIEGRLLKFEEYRSKEKRIVAASGFNDLSGYLQGQSKSDYMFKENSVSYNGIRINSLKGVGVIDKVISDYQGLQIRLSYSITNQGNRYASDGQKCTSCRVGIYQNGTCTVCDAASKELINEHKQKLKNNKRIYNQIKCPVCNGVGCKTCGYEGIIIP